MSPYEYGFCNRRLSIRQGQVGHTDEKLVGLTVKDQKSNVMAFIKPEDAPAVALALLDAGGVTDKNDGGKLGAACLNLRGYVQGRKAEAERESEDAKVAEFRKASDPGNHFEWHELKPEAHDAWRKRYRAARKFFEEEQ